MDSEVPEQVIDVTKISQDRIHQRMVDWDLRHSQMAEQLVSRVSQIVDNPVPRGRGVQAVEQGQPSSVEMTVPCASRCEYVLVTRVSSALPCPAPSHGVCERIADRGKRNV